MPDSIIVESDRERIVHVYPDRVVRTSSGGSASVRSPISSGGSRSLSSEESWSEVDFEDGIHPSDSASRPLHHRSRRHTVEVRDAPSRQSSRRTVDDREHSLPRRHTSRSHHSSSRRESRHARSHSRRIPSDESSGSVASPDDYPPYSHHGVPRAPYPPQSGYRHVPAQSHGGYQPSMTSGYPDPYNPQAMIHLQRHDHFNPSQQANPFAAQSHQPNPFSPMGNPESANYFDPHLHRPPGPGRPQSYAATSPYGTELMPSYSHGYPGYGFPPPMPPYGWHAPPSQGNSPAPKDEEALKTLTKITALEDMLQKQAEAMEAARPKPKIIDHELEGQKELLKRLQEDLLAQQKALQKEREEEAAAKALAKARAEEEKRRKEDISAASKQAKEEAEKKAAEAAVKAKEDHDKKLAEAQKAKEDSEKAKKALEDEIAKNKPTPDSLKAPIRFKDAVGRKFSFPWHLCKSWKGMETLIKQAFLHVDLIGDHVHQGHYDLTGPDGEIILPQVWDTMVQPDWEITMHLWPMPEDERRGRFHDDLDGFGDPFNNLGLDGLGLGPPPGGELKKSKSKKEKDKKGKSKSSASQGYVNVHHVGGHADPYGGLLPGGPIGAVVADKDKAKAKGKARGKSVSVSPWQSFLLGGGARKPKK